MQLADFQIDGTISRGSFGVVYKAVRKVDGAVFALKQIDLKDMKRADREEAIDEARMLASLDSPYVIKHLNSFIEGTLLNIVMEYASNGTVHQVIKAAKGKGIAEDRIWKYFLQTLMAIGHIHEHKIIHRDIKTLNLFLDANDNIKVGDLGVARALSNNSIFARTIVGTPYYLSPELCEDKPYNEKSDVWALGVVLYECCTGQHPFDAQNEGALIRKILRGVYAPVQGSYSRALISIVDACLTFDVRQRPDARALLNSPDVKAKANALGIDLSGRVPQRSRASPADLDRALAAARQAQPLQQPKSLAQPEPPMQQLAPFNNKPDNVAQLRASPAQVAAPAAKPGKPHPFEGPLAAKGVSPAVQAQHHNDRIDEAGAAQRGAQVGRGAAGSHPFGEKLELHQRMDRLHMEAAQPSGQAGDVQHQDRKANQHAGQQDHMRSVLAHVQAESQPSTRLAPELLPAAGCRGDQRAWSGYAHRGGQEQNSARFRTVAQEQQAALHNATYERPQFARRRCLDLQITGPSLRGGAAAARPASAGGMAAAGAGGYAASAVSANTRVFATSYAESAYTKA
ncbi:hypothetical protein WJX72_003948 [[Myrmecia] bisecta]|uniref:non-specific serine/threonine protein kinase n=1 Tax=[Myrmecia] bisecta TaxID=41462 RepID=A0AAW1PWN7_9CHLO